ncbi:ADP-ribosylglycohydrolase family protein [uncultured Sphaerochaeta sp.]|uniref:ADP-ribosylglycohydrolase family protein n=1 Tax=uncultured Sphaerochaeta sp. TaxID=886478 RepID=UPI002A0A1E93|nr:ADP-ribosylglycohydrolase family protein [uncultured Sphaerochaeta sp.]
MAIEHNVSRAYGALLGVAIGDALGMPVEMWSRKHIKDRFSWIDSFLPGPDDNSISAGFVPYETTDDTYMTMLVAKNLCDNHGSYSIQRFVDEVLQWDREAAKTKTVIGPSTRSALEKIQKGMTPVEAGKNGITNGAAMKIIPAGLVSSLESGQSLVSLVHEICKPTHNTDCAVGGACAITAFVAGCLAGKYDLPQLLDIACSYASIGERVGYETIGPSVAKRIHYALEITEGEHNDDTFLDCLYYRVGTGLPIIQTVPAAFAIVKHAGGDLLTAAKLAANVGGDTDTIGAIACGMCGAYQGADAIPLDIKESIEKQNPFSFLSIAEQLIEIRFL